MATVLTYVVVVRRAGRPDRVVSGFRYPENLAGGWRGKSSRDLEEEFGEGHRLAQCLYAVFGDEPYEWTSADSAAWTAHEIRGGTAYRRVAGRFYPWHYQDAEPVRIRGWDGTSK